MDIIKLDNTYHKEVVDFFGQDIEDFYFIISDLIRNNYSEEEFKVYGEFEENKLKSILINNFNNLTYYSKEDRDIDVYKGIMNDLKFKKISGPKDLVEKFIPLVKVQGDISSYMGYFNELVYKRKYEDLSIGFIKTEEEIGMQYDLLMSTEEYQDILPIDKYEYIMDQKSIINVNSRTAYLLADNKMVAACSTIAEYDKSAIVVGVVTDPKFRNKGYGTEVLIELFNNLLNEGKYPYLFYNNPAARSVYKKIGIKEVCEWRVMFVEE